MSIMDNEGHDPQGLFNTPSRSEIARLRQETEDAKADALRMHGEKMQYFEANLNLRLALAKIGYLEVTNLGTEAESGRPPRYFECRLCGDWNDEAKHIEHADGCPLHSSGLKSAKG